MTRRGLTWFIATLGTLASLSSCESRPANQPAEEADEIAATVERVAGLRDDSACAEAISIEMLRLAVPGRSDAAAISFCVQQLRDLPGRAAVAVQDVEQHGHSALVRAHVSYPSLAGRRLVLTLTRDSTWRVQEVEGARPNHAAIMKVLRETKQSLRSTGTPRRVIDCALDKARPAVVRAALPIAFGGRLADFEIAAGVADCT